MNARPGMEPEVDLELEMLLLKLQPTPARDALRAARARDAFLAEAAHITPRVSNLLQERPDRWKRIFGSFWFTTRKEKRSVFNLVMTVLLTLGAVFGGGASTVAVAQAAQPSDALYFVKTWSEDVRMNWETDPQAKLGLTLQFAARRAEEIRTMLQAGGTIPTALLSRFESEDQQALSLAASMPDLQAVPALVRVRDQARLQEQTMAQLQLALPVAEQTRARVRTMLQTYEQLAQLGIDNPDRLREQLRLRERDQLRLDVPTVAAPESVAPTLSGGNPWAIGTPIPDSSYGPGESQNPWTDEIPTPGSGYGPGPGTGECADCTGQPSGQGSGSQTGSGGGSQPGNGGSQGPGGNGGTKKP
jgi:uncharacterized membrane protein YgcG